MVFLMEGTVQNVRLNCCVVLSANSYIKFESGWSGLRLQKF